MTHDADTPVILVVDDEQAFVDAYRRWLGDTYTVREAISGTEAFEQLDEDVAVVLLDRRMPGISGDEVLKEIRSKGLDCRVAMVTAVEPDFDVIGMGFDEYIVKPVSKEQLQSVIEGLLTRSAFDDQVRECFALASKKAVLEANMSPRKLEAREEYRDLRDRLIEAQARVDDTLDELLESGNIVTAYHDIRR